MARARRSKTMEVYSFGHFDWSDDWSGETSSGNGATLNYDPWTMDIFYVFRTFDHEIDFG